MLIKPKTANFKKYFIDVMSKFIENYSSEIIYITVVIAIVVGLYLLTKVTSRWLTKKMKEQFPDASLNPINLIHKILTILWFVLGSIALIFVFLDADKESIFVKYFKLFSYLGVVSVITIVAIMVINLWFKYKVGEKIKNIEDPTNYKFLRYVVVSLVGLTGILLVLFAFPSLKGVAQTALGGAGVLALIVGFAAQEALANITGGLFIIAFKPFRIGDRVKVSDTMEGTVTDITLRHTIIRNYENKMIVIPNSIINKEKLINFDLDDKKICERIAMDISYDSDIDLAKKIMQEECENHPLIIDNRSLVDIAEGKPIVRTAVISLNDSSISVRAWAWVSDNSSAFLLRYDILESVKKRFDKEGIEIPFPYRTLVMKNSEENK